MSDNDKENEENACTPETTAEALGSETAGNTEAQTEAERSNPLVDVPITALGWFNRRPPNRGE